MISLDDDTAVSGGLEERKMELRDDYNDEMFAAMRGELIETGMRLLDPRQPEPILIPKCKRPFMEVSGKDETHIEEMKEDGIGKDEEGISPIISSDANRYYEALYIRCAIEYRIMGVELKYGDYHVSDFSQAKEKMEEGLPKRLARLEALLGPAESRSTRQYVEPMIKEALARIERCHSHYKLGRPSYMSQERWEVILDYEEERLMSQFWRIWGRGPEESYDQSE